MADENEGLWAAHGATWREPTQVIGFPGTAPEMHPQALECATAGPFWELLQEAKVALLVSREYEHLLVHLSAPAGRPHATFLQVPHPSGIAYDPARSTVHVACTRNPNQVLELSPATYLPRSDSPVPPQAPGTLLPSASRYYPGSLYLHDLAIIGGELYGNAVGHNAVVRLPAAGGFDRAWWPRAIDSDEGSQFTANLLQLNSIAAGPTLADSWFTASAAAPGAFRPGDPDSPVDGIGVAFDGRSRLPRVRGLTRPHSARLHQDALWLANSGYGELCRVAVAGAAAEPGYEVVTELPGWTRGLALVDGLAFVGTSRVIPKFAAYAPGLDVAASGCGIHAVDIGKGVVVASLTWPLGNQIFAIEALPAGFTPGLPGLITDGRAQAAGSVFYYSATTEGTR